MKKIHILVFFTSLILISCQILFSRIFSIKEGQSFISLLISLALLGFGFSGTLLTLIKKKIEKRLNEFFNFFVAIFVLSIMVGFFIYSIIPLNTLEFLWDIRQPFYFFLYFLALIVPFTAGGLVIGISFLFEVKAHTIYFSNLTGSAAGGIIPLILMNFFYPYEVLLIVLIAYIFIFGIYLLLFYKIYKNQFFLFIPLLVIFFFIFHFSVIKFNLLEYSQYKGISMAMRLPESQIIDRKITPHGIIEIVEAKGLRRVNGLSYNFTKDIPQQKIIYIDGNQSGVIIKFNNLSQVEYVNWCSQAFPYYILSEDAKKNLLVIGSGAEGILRGISSGFDKICVVENNRKLMDILKKDKDASKIYLHPKVEIFNLEARNFFKINKKRFDLIEMNLYDSFVSSTIQSLNENYLYTVEGLYEAYSSLSDKGILSISRWAISPMNDAIKIFSTAIKMCERFEIEDYKKKIAFIRSANTVTLCISKSEIQVKKVKEFSDKMYFDILYCNGITIDKAAQYFKQKEGISQEIIEKLLSNERKKFIEDYSYDVAPQVDNKPYYYNFFKWKTLRLILTQSRHTLPFHEWGYGILLLLLIFVIFVGFFLILFPVLKMKSFTLKGGGSFYFYFFLIGIAFFFVEVPLIQKLTLFLSYPVYSFSIVLTSLLFFSGLGSYFSGKISSGVKRKLIFLIPLSIIISNFILDLFLNRFANLLLWQRLFLTLVIAGFPAFFMGFPFPSAIEILKSKNLTMAVSVAWAINGFASVISALLSSILAMNFGFNAVLSLSVLFYFISGLLFYKFSFS